jgi:hypothetical protein
VGVIPGGIVGGTIKAVTTGKVGGSVFANGIPLVKDGDGDSCLTHTRTFGSPDVKAA